MGYNKSERRARALELVGEATSMMANERMQELVTGYATDCRRSRNSQGDFILANRLRSVCEAYDERPWGLTQPARFALLTGEAIGLLA